MLEGGVILVAQTSSANNDRTEPTRYVGVARAGMRKAERRESDAANRTGGKRGELWSGVGDADGHGE